MSLVVKTRIPYSDDIRRFCISTETSLSALQTTLKTLYPSFEGRIAIKYQVSDAEVREITTEAEFRAAVTAARDARPPILRLVVEQRAEDLLDSTWIVVPEESNAKPQPQPTVETPKALETKPVVVPATEPKQTPSVSSSNKLFGSSLPVIFAFQLPSFSGSPLSSSTKLEEAIRAADNILQAQAPSESVPMDLEPQLQAPSIPSSSEQMLFDLEETQPVAVLQPAPAKRQTTAELCSQLSHETKDSCISLSNDVLMHSMPLSKETLLHCMQESASILSQIGTSPSNIAKECSKLSEETSRMCGQLSSDIAASVSLNGVSPNIRSDEELSVLQSCESLSKSTAQDCRALSRNIVAEILAL